MFAMASLPKRSVRKDGAVPIDCGRGSFERVRRSGQLGNPARNDMGLVRLTFQEQRPRPKRARTSSFLVAACILAMSPPALGQQAGLEGTWNGTGTVILPSGDRERARCRATFHRQSSNSIGMNAMCATASTRIAQSAELTRTSANRFSGEFYNSEYSFSGSIAITVQGNRLNATLVGGGGSAHFNLTR